MTAMAGDEHGKEIAQDWQQGHEPPATGQRSFIAAFHAGAFDALIDETLDHMPDQIGCEQNHHAAQYAADYAAGGLVFHQSACSNANDGGEPGGGKRDDDHPCAPFDEHFEDRIPGFWRIVRSGEERLHDCAGRPQNRRQDERIDADPQRPARAGNPQQPEQAQIECKQPLLDAVSTGCNGGFRAVPNDFECDRQKAKADYVNDQALDVGGKIKRDHHRAAAHPVKKIPVNKATRRYQKAALISSIGIRRTVSSRPPFICCGRFQVG